MNNTKTTKRALLSSVVAMLVCITMLIGTTFAWFTDKVTSSGNIIKSGKLDISATFQNTAADGTISYTVPGFNRTTGGVIKFSESKTDINENNKIIDEQLWEPGAVGAKLITVNNDGNLAAKIKLNFNVNDGGLQNALWYDFIMVNGNSVGGTFTEREMSTLTTYAGTVQLPLMAGDSVSFILVYGMKEEAGNEYQEKSFSADVTILATQYTHEKDSFDNQYDKDATYPVIVSNQQQANAAITDATDRQVNISIASGQTITLDNGIANEGDNIRDITFSGNGSQTVDVITNTVSAEGGQLNYQRGSSFTFENLTIQAGEGSFDGIVCDELTFKNCTIKGKLTLFGKATFINCDFDNTMDNQYSIWTWGGTDVTFEDCIFNTNGKAILLYGGASASNPTNLVVNNCTFNDRNSGAAGKAAIEIGNDFNATYTLTVNNATVNGFADGQNTGSKLWANKNNMDAAHLTVTIDGSRVN